MATKSEKEAARTGRVSGAGAEGQSATTEAMKNFQNDRTVDNPDLGPDDNVIPSPYSEQTLAARIANGEGEEVREELAEAAEGVADKKAGEAGRRESTNPRADKSDTDR